MVTVLQKNLFCFGSSLHVIASLGKKHQESHRQSKELLLNVEVAVQGSLCQADFGEDSDK